MLDRLRATDNTVAIVGVVVSGLAVFGARFPALAPVPRAMALTAALLAALAVISIIAYQIRGAVRSINSANLVEVRAWYVRQVNSRLLADAGLILLVLSIVLAVAAAGVALATAAAAQPAVTVSQIPDAPGIGGQVRTETVTITSAFHGLPPGQAAVTVVTDVGSNRVLASSAVTPAGDGAASDTLTVGHISVSAQLVVTATAAGQYCRAVLGPGHKSPALICGT
jgi:hypothetical protein